LVDRLLLMSIDHWPKWYQWEVALAIEMAEEELRQLDEVRRKVLWNSIKEIFKAWKAEHRKRKEQADRAEAQDHPSDQAATSLMYSMVWHKPIELFFQLWRESYPPLQRHVHPEVLAQTLATLILHDNEDPARRLSIRRAGDLLFRLQRKRDRFIIQSLAGKARLGELTVQNLRAGPAVAAEAKKRRTEELHRQWVRMSADLYRAKPGWTLEDHAIYIKEQTPKQKNGKPYAIRTIVDVIKGQRSSILPRPTSASPD
jgi:hypothetical protein